MIGAFNGVPVRFSDHALEETEERLFPENRYRSARIHKKLVKRHGGEFRMKPCVFQMQVAGTTMIVAHPAHRHLFENLERGLSE